MDKDTGTIAALMIRFKEYRLPRAMRMLDRVNAGETLMDNDIAFLKRVFDDARANQQLVKRNPEYSELVSRAVALYEEIVAKAMENEKAQS
mgnify:CR=1 FL=1|jgi:hypothetical protein